MLLLSEFKKLVSYSLSPVYLERPVTRDSTHLFKVLPFLILLDFFLTAISVFLLIIFGVMPNNHVISSLHFGVAVNLFIIAFLGPLLEETAFRLAMRYHPRNLSLGIAVWSYFSTNMVLNIKNYDISNYLFPRVVIACSVGILVFAVFKNKTSAMTQIWRKHFKIIYYLLTLAFGYVHLNNFQDLKWYLVPIATLPQLINAFILGYVRMHYGFACSVAMHCFKNGLSGLGGK